MTDDPTPAERELLAAIDELKARRQRLDTNDAERHLLQLAIYEYSQQVIYLRRNRLHPKQGV
jgi:L-ribulose-5-phosphate 3-epimerase UlaE